MATAAKPAGESEATILVRILSKEELSAFGKAGDLLAIPKSKARQVLGVKLKSHVTLIGTSEV